MKNYFLGEAAYEVKNVCQKCKRSSFCKTIEQEMRELNQTEIPVWDKEAFDKISYIKSELQMLGFSFPKGIKLCKLSKLSHGDIQDLIQYIHSVKEDHSA